MNFWTAVVAIIAIVSISEVIKAKLRTGTNRIEAQNKEYERRFSQLENRMTNLETIVLEKEQTKKYAEL